MNSENRSDKDWKIQQPERDPNLVVEGIKALGGLAGKLIVIAVAMSLAAAVALAIAVPFILFEAFVYMKIWNWHVIEVFQVPAINLAEAFVFGLLVSLPSVGIAHRLKKVNPEPVSVKNILEGLFNIAMTFAIALFLAWIVKVIA